MGAIIGPTPRDKTRRVQPGIKGAKNGILIHGITQGLPQSD